MAGFAAADLCGVLGAPASADASARTAGCRHLGAQARIAAARARRSAFSTPGVLTWGWTGENGGAGALAALAARAGRLSNGRAVATAARDHLLGRNPWQASFVAGFGPGAPRNLHHWASVFGKGKPAGAVVGGPAPIAAIREQEADGGFRLRASAFNAPGAAYEDNAGDYVTSEPAIDYAAGSILLLAALRPR